MLINEKWLRSVGFPLGIRPGFCFWSPDILSTADRSLGLDWENERLSLTRLMEGVSPREEEIEHPSSQS